MSYHCSLKPSSQKCEGTLQFHRKPSDSYHGQIDILFCTNCHVFHLNFYAFLLLSASVWQQIWPLMRQISPAVMWYPMPPML
eukprot:2235508-Amphidinium_carterae.1